MIILTRTDGFIDKIKGLKMKEKERSTLRSLRYVRDMLNEEDRAVERNENMKKCRWLGALLSLVMIAAAFIVPSTAAELPFKDVPEDSWYYSYVSYVYENQLFSGTSETTFEPGTLMTRAMFVRLMANFDGVDLTDYTETPFEDVEDGSWYESAVAWAAENKVVLGTSETTFNPGDPITREQMCQLLLNYTVYAEITLNATAEEAEFSDADQISGWAAEAVRACQTAEIVSGKGGNVFDPQGTASRAEAATLLTNFHKLYAIAAELSITDFVIVYPAGGTVYEQYAAELLESALEEQFDVDIKVAADSEAAERCEILIGETNRGIQLPESREEPVYYLYRQGNKIVVAGDESYICAAAGDLARAAEDLSGLSNEPEAMTPAFEKADNIILMIGDGMGRLHVKAAETQWAKKDAPAYGGARTFAGWDLMYNSRVSTWSNNSAVTDSAASGTALSSGYKTNNGYVGIDPDGVSRQNIRELAASKGAKTGVITTEDIAGATPAAFTAHVLDRGMTEEIHRQQDALDIDYIKGMGSGPHPMTNDKLLDNVKEALDILDAGDRFFLMVEEAYTDKMSHQNEMVFMIHAMDRFDRAIRYALSYTMFDRETVLLITADHETGGIVENEDGTFSFTTNEHTGNQVYLFAVGAGTEIFDGKMIDNTDIAKFMATTYGVENFGEY